MTSPRRLFVAVFGIVASLVFTMKPIAAQQLSAARVGASSSMHAEVRTAAPIIAGEHKSHFLGGALLGAIAGTSLAVVYAVAPGHHAKVDSYSAIVVFGGAILGALIGLIAGD